ncbi:MULTISPECIES: hypothetical protein [Vibrio]|uniref:hypothetical protein n=1 Tax=Vibrio TaxID=662 RepID=UPI001123B68A|nr:MULTISPECIES: hypothetical protein [Vibrio]MCK8111367.1 hypothetical protein [Vibrio sp. 2CM40D]TNZ01616.1 hypothetical protein CGK57_03555 [Vibrio parahaemolyticus]ULF70055.1 hypothetical protein K6745_06240 [Vibrio alginolyticus]
MMQNDKIIEQVLEADMSTILANNPSIKALIERHSPTTYKQFVSRIYTDLENIISTTESGKQHHQTKGEDELTDHLLSQLVHLYPSALHDPQKGGHCDLHLQVRSPEGILFTWVGEAKLWGGYAYGRKGLFDQLLDSYASGGEHANQGGIIFYDNSPSGASFAMGQWKKGLQAENVQIEDEREDKLRFSTKHMLNEGNGPEFYVRHFVVGLYHKPTVEVLERKKRKG